MASMKILLVGGHTALERAIRTGLGEGTTLVTTPTVDAAMTLISEGPPSVVVVGPAAQRGLTLVTLLKQDKDRARIPVLVVHRDDAIAEIARHKKTAARADAYLSQNTSKESLARAVRDLLPKAAPVTAPTAPAQPAPPPAAAPAPSPAQAQADDEAIEEILEVEPEP